MNNENKRIFSPENLKRYAIMSKKQLDLKAKNARFDSTLYFYASVISVLIGAYISVVEGNPLLIDDAQINTFYEFHNKIYCPTLSVGVGIALHIKAIEQVCKAAGLDVKSLEIEKYLKSLGDGFVNEKSEGGRHI